MYPFVKYNFNTYSHANHIYYFVIYYDAYYETLHSIITYEYAVNTLYISDYVIVSLFNYML